MYELCVVRRFLIVNPQGPDLFVVPGRTHLPEDVPDRDASGIGWADSPTETDETAMQTIETSTA